jgi:hypothetical protein
MRPRCIHCTFSDEDFRHSIRHALGIGSPCQMYWFFLHLRNLGCERCWKRFQACVKVSDGPH